MHPMVSTGETPMVNVPIGSMEFLDRNLAGEEFPVTTTSTVLTTSSFSMLLSDDRLSFNNQRGESVSMSNHLDPLPYSELNCEAEPPQLMYGSLGEEKLSILNKRKAAAELTPSNGLQNMLITNKRAAKMGSFPEGFGLSQVATQNKRAEAHSRSPRTTAPRTKRSQSLLKDHKIQSVVSSVTEPEIIDPVRVKLRESLTAALALVLEEKASPVNVDKAGDVAVVPAKKGEQPATSVSASVSSANIEIAGEGSGSSGSQEFQLKDVPGDDWKFVGQDFPTNPIFPGQDAPFGDSLYFRDELLQGNGLSWAMDFDSQIAEMQAVESTVKDGIGFEDSDVQEIEQVDMSPESVAVRVESELFTLFGGVNKKYKEKGRSLLFNLKDRNNPELRERVMSGEISPERLCKMTAEELASKELSQWRMAKAEELDQMKVLPDSEVRRLVKKTHKGEYQVEFDSDISVVEDVPVNVTVAQDNAKKRTSGGDAGHYIKSEGAMAHGDGQCQITIPGDGADMQGLMVDDIRDLPPILSLDEFMESLDKEPPFESLPVDSGKRTPDADNETSGGDAESRSPALHLEDSVVSTEITTEVDLIGVKSESRVKSAEKERLSEENITAERTETDKEVDMDKAQYDALVKSAESQRASEFNIMTAQSKIEHLWQGLLQLTLSSTAYVVARYKSGEKACTRNWPGFVEIKGRVRLDAFDKFLQELPKSRTRATTVVHLTLTDRCTDEERCNLIDLIDSYVSDQRIGYAEPLSGVELYLCPPRSKTVDMIVTHLPKSYTEDLKDIENGLIGILVWRKERMPSASLPNPSSQPKPIPAVQQQSTSGSQLSDKDAKRNVHISSTVVPPPPTFSKPPPSSSGDDDEAPPGFGLPGGTRDDDDLPEFNFCTGPSSSRFPTPKLNNLARASHQHPEPPSRQVEQMRELIQKYGKSSNNNSINGIPIQPWNDDDDDDIPEWQPQAIHQHQQPAHPSGLQTQTHLPGCSPFQQPSVPLVNPMPPLQPNIAAQGAWRHPGPNIAQPAGSPRRGPAGAQFYRAPVTGHQSRGSRGRGRGRGKRPSNKSSRSRNF